MFQNHNSLIKQLKVPLIAGTAVLLGGIICFYQMKIKQKITVGSAKQIPDDLLIQFLKELKSQSYPHIFLVAGIIRKLRDDSVDDNEFNHVFLQIKPEIESLFEAKQKLVLGKYPYTLEQIQKALSNSKNERIIKIQEQFQVLYSNSMQGNSPEINLQLKTINRFDQDEIVRIIQEVLNCSLSIIYKICKQLKDINGKDYEISLQRPDFVKLLHENGFQKKKREIIVNHNLCMFELEHDELGEPQSPTEVLAKITQYHKNQDKNYRQKIDMVEKKYEILIGKFMKESVGDDEATLLIAEAKNSQ